MRAGTEAADGKNMLSLLQLGVVGGDEIVVSASGDDADAALEALYTAVTAGLDDEEEEESTAVTGSLDWQPTGAKQTVEGVAAEVKTRLGASKAAIFQAHAELLNDNTLIQATVRQIFAGHGAAWAWQQVIAERVAQMEKLDDPLLAARAVDLSDVGQRVLRKMLGLPSPAPISGDEPIILVAHDLTPSDTAALETDAVRGFCTATGGPTSHTAIMARSLGIQALVAAGEQVLEIANGTPSILDGFNGKLYLEPGAADIAAAQQMQQQIHMAQSAAYDQRHQPATTTEGHHVEVAANINRASDAPAALENGAEGVGLMRTEFLFLESDTPPTEETQFKAYHDMIAALAGRPLIIRTMDIGGDKNVDYLGMTEQDNSFLGLRGIRLCLARPELFKTQLRAIYRAAATAEKANSVQIMFPMIATLDDFEQAQAIAEQVRQELNAPHLPLGMMIEVPSAVVLADQFAAMVDFFSVGTNDLTQYVLAMDRLHPQLAKRTDSLHPAVLRMIDQTVKAARKHNIWVGVCGSVTGIVFLVTTRLIDFEPNIVTSIVVVFAIVLVSEGVDKLLRRFFPAQPSSKPQKRPKRAKRK